MTDEMKQARAREVYADLCRALDAKGWIYDKDEENLRIDSGCKSEDLPIRFLMRVDASRQQVKLFSTLPVTVPEDKSRPTTFPTGIRYSDANTPVVNIQMKTMAMIRRLVNFFIFQPSFSSVPLIWLSECFVNAEIAEKSGKTFIAKFCHLL